METLYRMTAVMQITLGKKKHLLIAIGSSVSIATVLLGKTFHESRSVVLGFPASSVRVSFRERNQTSSIGLLGKVGAMHRGTLSPYFWCRDSALLARNSDVASVTL